MGCKMGSVFCVLLLFVVFLFLVGTHVSDDGRGGGERGDDV